MSHEELKKYNIVNYISFRTGCMHQMQKVVSKPGVCISVRQEKKIVLLFAIVKTGLRRVISRIVTDNNTIVTNRY